MISVASRRGDLSIISHQKCRESESGKVKKQKSITNLQTTNWAGIVAVSSCFMSKNNENGERTIGMFLFCPHCNDVKNLHEHCKRNPQERNKIAKRFFIERKN